MAKQYNIWWGPPKKFSNHFEERKISWLELFYDLVYVIVISKITHNLASHPGLYGILDYTYLFAMTFWGWFNGSQYHDLHGSPGIRTRFMTLWQMMAVGALAVTLESPPETLLYRATISISILQFYITYLWWSVGIYDKHHRKLNVPYTICYLTAFALLILTLFIPQPYKRIIFWITLVLNYIPPFIIARKLKRINEGFSLSASMMERLGLFTIIVFGEAILGAINGMGSLIALNAHVWVCFGLGILIVFALWWIFFSLIADRESRKGLALGSIVALVFLPTLASLGMVGASFPALLENVYVPASHSKHLLQLIYGASITGFLCSTAAISRLVIYPKEYLPLKRRVQLMLIGVGLLNIALTCIFSYLTVIPYLLCVFISLLCMVIVIIRGWFLIELQLHKEEN